MESKLKGNGSSIRHLEDDGINEFLSKLHSHENYLPKHQVRFESMSIVNK